MRKSPGDELARLVDEEAAVGVAVPGDAEVGLLGAHLLDDEGAVLGQQRVGLVVGELAVGLPVVRDELERVEPLEHGADHRARHAVAAVEHDLQRAHGRRVDEPQRRFLELGVDVDVLRAARRRRVAQPVREQPADVADAGVARQRHGAALDQLRARVGLRVVRGRAHQPAVEVARADEVIEHLRADHPGVEHVRALGDQALAIACGELGGGEAHVAPEADPQLARRLVRQLRQHARERAADRLRHVAVYLLAVEAADVVGLEDLGGC